MSSRQALALGEMPCGHHEVPSIGPGGQLTYRNRSVCLSERNALIAAVFVYRFEDALTDLELLDRSWPEGATRWTLRLALRQLNRRLARVGLGIDAVGEHAHVLRPIDTPPAGSDSA